MKNILFFILICIVCWLVWDRYHTKPPAPVVIDQRPIKKVVIAEKYEPILREIVDSLFSPLDSDAPNPIALLSTLDGSARADLRNGVISEIEGRLIVELTARLRQMNSEREGYEIEYRGIINRVYPSFKGREGGESKRQFYLDDLHRRWSKTVNKNRQQINADVVALREAERQREHDQAASVVSNLYLRDFPAK